MKTLYDRRKINSLYYDTSSIDMFKDSEEGFAAQEQG